MAAGFRTGTLGSPFSTEYFGSNAMGVGNDTRSGGAPKVGPGKAAKQVSSEIGRSSTKAGRKGGKASK